MIRRGREVKTPRGSWQIITVAEPGESRAWVNAYSDVNVGVSRVFPSESELWFHLPDAIEEAFEKLGVQNG